MNLKTISANGFCHLLQKGHKPTQRNCRLKNKQLNPPKTFVMMIIKFQPIFKDVNPQIQIRTSYRSKPEK